ncbi:MAG: ParB/RepB/Spo0J family partition protein [Eubacteriales bacterium]|nr:ParB/RepB/Spo0J family partition protein [Eubacteriales bacterium]
MAKKAGLGRGLSALLGETENFVAPGDETAAGERVERLSIESIDPNADQPRKLFDQEALEQLAASIRSVGVLQPILVQKNEGRYSIIAGERRWRAARMAGLSEIPAIVRDMQKSERFEAALIENLQRDDLNPVEEARGVRALMEQCGYTQEAVAERLGKSRPAVANLLRLLGLPEEILNMLAEGRLSAGHARALAGLNDRLAQIRLANLAAAQGWSVRQMEKICAAQNAPEEKPAKPERPRPAEFSQLENMARRAFGTKAELDGDEKKGRLILRYYSQEDLQRIWDMLASITPEE